MGVLGCWSSRRVACCGVWWGAGWCLVGGLNCAQPLGCLLQLLHGEVSVQHHWRGGVGQSVTAAGLGWLPGTSAPSAPAEEPSCSASAAKGNSEPLLGAGSTQSHVLYKKLPVENPLPLIGFFLEALDVEQTSPVVWGGCRSGKTGSVWREKGLSVGEMGKDLLPAACTVQGLPAAALSWSRSLLSCSERVSS